MKFADFPFLRYLLFLLLGIFIARVIPLPSLWIILLMLGLTWLTYFLLVLQGRKLRGMAYQSFVAYLALMLTGMFLVQHKTSQKPDVYLLANAEQYLAEVTQYDQTKPNSSENLLQVKSVFSKGKWHDASAKVIVYHQGDSLMPGELIWVNQAPDRVDHPRNPGEFNYAAYLERKGIYFRQFIGKDFQVISTVADRDWKYALTHLRHKMAVMLKSKIPNERSAQIALALLLGQKNELDPRIREAYTQAGVMHILAVSGLHVGIIYALFLLILKPLKLKKAQSRLFLFGVICLIWGYAFLTGLSPSVVRASTMFTLLTLGQMRERKPSIYNILAFSAMLMIVSNPDVIYEVGFQLSYLAVLGIVMLYPLILNLWLPRSKVVDYFWKAAAVSIAAQLATFPLSVFYFHTFPVYFLLGNLLILPLAFVIMQVGVPLMILGWIPKVGDVLGGGLSLLIWLQNWLAGFIQSIPGGKIDRLTISMPAMILVWSLIIMVAFWERESRKQLVWLVLVLFFCWGGNRAIRSLRKPVEQLIVYQGSSGLLLDYAYSDQVFSWNEGLEGDEISYSVDPFRVANHWPLMPASLAARAFAPGQIELIGTGLVLDQKKKNLRFLKSPNSVEIWGEKGWEKVSLSDSVSMDSLAYRILF
ncbi:ComEC/Rec2 family competence protein [Algoriphagus halophytocola]|uniref:Competence protein ComEC family protein n=1 Tax=Algoriphagus halophytocola TaxID=2991499 RepID=A0ABY6MN99_9BACT|nr:ComEC/Rec2 family competence protein [Algoriphagus sp. TR-M5]UZD24628.1 competence protein ComEC family protein [Algoriphagus sp. TR-M5]